MILFDPQSVQFSTSYRTHKILSKLPKWIDHRDYYEVNTMKLKNTFSIQDKNIKDLDNGKDYSTIKDLMKEQGVSTDLS
ncbi:hypothetical protein CU305_05720 [Prochlorococcus marinus str. MU1416]|nr:hypothetical protein [Prochlorococcus marinus str. MU1416]